LDKTCYISVYNRARLVHRFTYTPLIYTRLSLTRQQPSVLWFAPQPSVHDSSTLSLNRARRVHRVTYTPLVYTRCQHPSVPHTFTPVCPSLVYTPSLYNHLSLNRARRVHRVTYTPLVYTKPSHVYTRLSLTRLHPLTLQPSVPQQSTPGASLYLYTTCLNPSVPYSSTPVCPSLVYTRLSLTRQHLSVPHSSTPVCGHSTTVCPSTEHAGCIVLLIHHLSTPVCPSLVNTRLSLTRCPSLQPSVPQQSTPGASIYFGYTRPHSSTPVCPSLASLTTVCPSTEHARRVHRFTYTPRVYTRLSLTRLT
jgi:hypothetical protein